MFPKLVFAIREGVNRRAGDINYDIKQLALECASKRIPDILNYDKVVEVTGSFKTPMGCRSFLGVYEENGEQIHEGQQHRRDQPQSAAHCVRSRETKPASGRCWMHAALAKRALMTLARLEKTKARVAPILYMEGACGIRLNADDEVGKIFRNGRASISLGYIGLHETLNALSGNAVHPYDAAHLRATGVAIVTHLRKAVDAWKAETGYGFSLYSTPSETCAIASAALMPPVWRGAGRDRQGLLHQQLPSRRREKVNPYDKIDFEAPYPAIANGGFICYGEYPTFSTTCGRWKMCGITAMTACPITAPTRRSMSATSAASAASSAVPAKALPVRAAAITIRRAFRSRAASILAAGCAAVQRRQAGRGAAPRQTP